MQYFYVKGWIDVQQKPPSKNHKKLNWNKELKVVLVKKKWKNSSRKYLWTLIFTHLGLFTVQTELIRKYLRTARSRIKKRYRKTYGKDTTLIPKNGNRKRKRLSRRK